MPWIAKILGRYASHEEQPDIPRRVEIFCHGVRVAAHGRGPVPHLATTLHDHRSKSHQTHLEWTPSRFTVPAQCARQPHNWCIPSWKAIGTDKTAAGTCFPVLAMTDGQPLTRQTRPANQFESGRHRSWRRFVKVCRGP